MRGAPDIIEAFKKYVFISYSLFERFGAKVGLSGRDPRHNVKLAI